MNKSHTKTSVHSLSKRFFNQLDSPCHTQPNLFNGAVLAALTLLSLWMTHPLASTDPFDQPASKKDIAMGEKLFYDPEKGNCTACHFTKDSANLSHGNLGHTLIRLQIKFPEIKSIRDKIFRSSANSVMPPFGSHLILTPEEIRQITLYLYTL